MKPFALIAAAFVVLGLGAPVATLANASEPVASLSTEIAVPVVDTFEDGDCRLRLIAMPSADLKTTQVTLVYEDRSLRTIRAVTVNPEVVMTSADARFNDFMAAMDDDFKSYVRATLADRLLHLTSEGTVLDRAESAIFFRTNDVRGNTARRVSALETAAE